MLEVHFPKIIYQFAGSQKPHFLLMPPVLEEIASSKLNNYMRGEMSSDTESYALGFDKPLSILRYQPCGNRKVERRWLPRASPRIKLYQLKSLKFRSFKAKMSRIKLLYQTEYSLIGTLRISKNID
jgi:hypothetical protein